MVDTNFTPLDPNAVYRIETIPEEMNLEEELAKMWDIGWRLVSVIPEGSRGTGWVRYKCIFINRAVDEENVG